MQSAEAECKKILSISVNGTHARQRVTTISHVNMIFKFVFKTERCPQ